MCQQGSTVLFEERLFESGQIVAHKVRQRDKRFPIELTCRPYLFRSVSSRSMRARSLVPTTWTARTSEPSRPLERMVLSTVEPDGRATVFRNVLPHS
jgi:hypothetical protein